MKSLLMNIAFLAALSAATPAPALFPRAFDPTGKIVQVKLFEEPGCLFELPIGGGGAAYDIVNVAIGQCIDAGTTKIGGGKFMSYKAYFTSSIPEGYICKTVAYFELDCGGTAASSDNFKPGSCINPVFDPANKPPSLTSLGAAVSFRPECCKSNDGKKCVNPLVPV